MLIEARDRLRSLKIETAPGMLLVTKQAQMQVLRFLLWVALLNWEGRIHRLLIGLPFSHDLRGSSECQKGGERSGRLGGLERTRIMHHSTISCKTNQPTLPPSIPASLRLFSNALPLPLPFLLFPLPPNCSSVTPLPMELVLDTPPVTMRSKLST